MHRNFARILGFACLAAACLFVSGCVTSKKYRLAPKDTPPAVPLAWTVEGHDAALSIDHVIVFKGPGSWKKEARWDEYVVTLRNPGAGPLVIEGIELVDPLGNLQVPGTDPWALEKLSYTNWEKYGKTGLKLLAGAGAVALYAGAVAMQGVAGMGMVSASAGAGGSVALLNVIPVVAIIDVTAVAVMNHNNKKAVLAKFEERRLSLPLSLAASEQRSGSCFFPMTPSPREIVVHLARGEEKFELRRALPELVKLHVKDR